MRQGGVSARPCKVTAFLADYKGKPVFFKYYYLIRARSYIFIW